MNQLIYICDIYYMYIDKDGRRPVHGNDDCYAKDPHFKDLVLFYEVNQSTISEFSTVHVFPLGCFIHLILFLYLITISYW